MVILGILLPPLGFAARELTLQSVQSHTVNGDAIVRPLSPEDRSTLEIGNAMLWVAVSLGVILFLVGGYFLLRQ